MCLIEDGKLKLKDSVSDYLSEFASIRVQLPGEPPRPPFRPITLLDLLTNTSGMGEDRCMPRRSRRWTFPQANSGGLGPARSRRTRLDRL
jgi:CubicO group peptidase (beta-lactamase class C family)